MQHKPEDSLNSLYSHRKVWWKYNLHAHWIAIWRKNHTQHLLKLKLKKDIWLFRLLINSSVVFNNNKKMLLWGWGVVEFSCIGNWFRWGTSQHRTNLPLEQKCQEGLWKCTDSSNYIDNLPFPEAEKSISYWQDSDKLLWKSERSQYSFCDRNNCEGFLVFTFLIFFFYSSSKQHVWKCCKQEKCGSIRNNVPVVLPLVNWMCSLLC